MRANLPWSYAPSTEQPVIEPLAAGDAYKLRLPWLSRFDKPGLERHLAAHPGHSLWIPASGEYVVAGPWRSREDIAQVLEVNARRGKTALLGSAVDLARERGYKLVLISDEVWSADARFFMGLSFSRLERIVFFRRELRRLNVDAFDRELPRLEFSSAGVHDLELLIQIDHTSFPWLWWNSPVEFESYIKLPDVQVITSYFDGKPVGYASFTMYKDWAHLDRLAVIEAEHGKGYGVAQLRHVLGLMQRLGATSVNLSTQEDNVRSHRLYQSHGFRQTTEKMSFYGREL